MSRPKNGWLAIVCAWRKGEDDLEATLQSAQASAGSAGRVIAIEDKNANGPGYNRHRGIEAAAGSEVIIVIDAHMRFDGETLLSMGRRARNGGLLVPYCYHNAECAFTGEPYAGARIVYRAKDRKEHIPLSAKWSKEKKPGQRGAVMGACYAFRRDWYYDVGQPLAMLKGWGCDEEALSIAAWLSGSAPELVDGKVAHRWRPSPPWPIATIDCQRNAINRAALVWSVADAVAQAELEAWGRKDGWPVVYEPTAEAKLFKAALLKQPRKWARWRAEVCEPDEIDGVQAGNAPALKPARKQHEPNIIVPVAGIQCPHCKTIKERFKSEESYKYPNGNITRRCECECGHAFRTMFYARSGASAVIS